MLAMLGWGAQEVRAQAATPSAGPTNTPAATAAPVAATPAPAASTGNAVKPPTSGTMPDWMVKAGGHMEFDIVSVKQNTAEQTGETVHSNIPLGPMDAFTPTGGLLQSANFPLMAYLVFAYKLNVTQIQAIQSQLPKWATTNRYDIQAKASGNPTKDQFRLMMQSLLADRFKMVAHFETKQVPVLVLVQDKPGKFGPHFQLHPADAECSSAPTQGEVVAGGFPQQCGVVSVQPSSAAGRIRVGGRNVPLTMLASMLSSQPVINISRPVKNGTGISQGVDFTMEFTPELPPGAGGDFKPDPNGPTFLQALKDDLGLKLESQTGTDEAVVIDQIEEPSSN